MVSFRCMMIVKDELTKLGLHAVKVDLGEVEIIETLSARQHSQIRYALERSGLELLEDKKNILVQEIKTAIIKIVRYSDEPLVLNLSAYLSSKLEHDYTYMSNLFSEKLGITIEKFYIRHKIERVKELLIYNELTLTEIAYKLHYSSLAHLSNQFKKITGFTPSGFKHQKDKNRSLLENI